MKSCKFKQILCAAVAAATILSLSACVMPIKEEKNLAAEDAAVMVANAPVVSAQTVIITGKTVNVRSGPGMKYMVVTVLPKGSNVTVLDTSNPDWYVVRTMGNVVGYCYSEYIKFI